MELKGEEAFWEENMKTVALEIKAGDFEEWYNSLSSASKGIYKKTLERIKEPNKDEEIRKVSGEIVQLVLKSEDDYEATDEVEYKIKKYLK